MKIPAILLFASLPTLSLHAAVPGYFRFPALSGDTVVFTSEGDLWTVPVSGGAPRRLTWEGEAANVAGWTPDGKVLYTTRAWSTIPNEQLAAASLDAACEDPAVRYVFGGHVHEQTLYFMTATHKLMRFAPTPGVPIPLPASRRWLATVGSVGQPRDGKTQAMYAMFDLARAELTFHRVPYDHLAVAADLRAAGLPEFFAKRMEEGR